MKTITKIAVPVCCVVLLLSGIIGCKKQGVVSEDGIERTPLQPLELPGTQEGLVTFLSGDVEKYSEESWVPLEIGDLIVRKDKVRVNSGSFCEIQFGDYAVLRIEEETFFSIADISAADEGSNITLDLNTGSLLCKVKRLGSGDSFTVLSPSMALGVRGTEFFISTADGREFRAAVRKGNVELFPASLLRADSPAKELLENYLDQKTISLDPNQELTIPAGTVAAVSAGNRTLIQFLESVEEVEVSQLEDSLADLSSAHSKIPAPGVISDESIQFLKKIDDLNEVNLQAGEGELVKIAVTSIPEAVSVLVNGRKEGITPYAGVFPAGTDIQLELRKPGYIARSVPLAIEAGGDMILKVTLEKDPTYVSSKESDGREDDQSREPEARKVRVGFTVTPASAVIRKDGKTVGTGKYSSEFSPGEMVQLTITDPLYEERQVEIEIGEESDQEYAFSLKLRPLVRTIPISDSPILFLQGIGGSGEELFAVDETGEAFLVTPEGDVRFSLQLGIVPKEEARPVFDGNRVYLLRGSRLVVADMNSGSLLFDVEVKDTDRFIYGRRVAVAGGKGVFPSDDAITFFSTETGEVLDERKIAQGMTMTPISVDNSLVTVNRKGQIIVLDENGEYDDIIPTSVLADGHVFAAERGDSMYFVDDRGAAVCLNSSSGSVVWESDALVSSGEETSPRHFFLETGSNGLYLYDGERVALLSKAGGELLFVIESGVGVPPLVHGGIMYFSSGKGAVLAYDGVTGKQRFSLPVGTEGTSKPIMQGKFLLLGLANGETAVINPRAFE